jgi:hypothetical protein
MVAVAGLDQHLARQAAAARPPADLKQCLQHLLRRPEVDAEQPAIGIDDHYKGDIVEVVTLGDHLGADEHVDSTDGTGTISSASLRWIDFNELAAGHKVAIWQE